MLHFRLLSLTLRAFSVAPPSGILWLWKLPRVNLGWHFSGIEPPAFAHLGGLIPLSKHIWKVKRASRPVVGGAAGAAACWRLPPAPALIGPSLYRRPPKPPPPPPRSLRLALPPCAKADMKEDQPNTHHCLSFPAPPQNQKCWGTGKNGG